MHYTQVFPDNLGIHFSHFYNIIYYLVSALVVKLPLLLQLDILDSNSTLGFGKSWSVRNWSVSPEDRLESRTSLLALDRAVFIQHTFYFQLLLLVLILVFNLPDYPDAFLLEPLLLEHVHAVVNLADVVLEDLVLEFLKYLRKLCPFFKVLDHSYKVPSADKKAFALILTAFILKIKFVLVLR